MESKPCKLIVASVSQVMTIKGLGEQTSKKQLLKLAEEQRNDLGNGKKPPHQNKVLVEIWNTGIDKFKLLDMFKNGDYVEVEFYINCDIQLTPKGEKPKNNLALKTIKKL